MSEDYMTGLFGCMDHTSSCIDVFFCYPCQAGRQCAALNGQIDTGDFVNCILAILCPYITICQIRSKVAAKFNIDEGIIGHCLKGWICAACSLCQTHRELTLRKHYPGGVCVSQPMQ